MKRILIVGCHRSGTTLMRLVLNSHPLIYCFDEGKSYRSLQSGDHSNEKNAEIVGFKIPNWTEYIVHSEEHRKLYNKDMILFMIRDVRATVASMFNLVIPKDGNPDRRWAENAINAVKNKWPNLPERGCPASFFEEVEKAEISSEPNYRKAALYWKYKTSKYLDMIRLGWPVFPVFYENLVLQPEAYLKTMFQFLEIEWSDDVLKHHTKVHSETGGDFAMGRTRVSRPIDAESVYKWKELLTVVQQEAVLEVARDLNSTFSFLRFSEINRG